MKVEKLSHWKLPMDGPGLLAAAGICGGGRNTDYPDEHGNSKRLAERPLPTVVPASQGNPEFYEEPVSIGSRAIQPHSAYRGTGTAFSPKPSKTRRSVRFSLRASFLHGRYAICE
jgi:hypothetical protein